MKSFLRPMDRPTVVCLVLLAFATAASLQAQEPTSEDLAAPTAEEPIAPVEPAVEAPICAAPEPRTITLAKMTPVYLSIDAGQGSKTSTSGETFPITVTEPVMLDGEEIIPVGTTGQGEVIHAKKAGGSGSAGELILTANYLDLGDQQIPLRSMKLGLSGKDQTGLAIVSSAMVVPVGFFIRGKNIDVPEGSLAGAKLAQDTQILIEGGNDAEPHKCTEGT